jgi:nucleotide-binding universal stress UspA family protein
MKEIKNILVPVDLSQSSPKLVPYATLMQEKFGSEIHLLFVVSVFDPLTSTYVSPTLIERVGVERMEGAGKRLQKFKEDYFKDLPGVKTVVTSGDVSKEILKYIQAEGIDLLIIGTHGRKGIEEAIFGSVANRVSKMATVPVLLVNPYTTDL